MRNTTADVIFDLDGTLIDSAPSILTGFAATLAAHDIESVVQLSEALIGPPLRQTLARISGVEDVHRLDSMVEGFKQHYDVAGYKATEVFPGVDSMLRELNKLDFRLHIATNKRLKPTQLILQHLGWTELFSHVYASDSRTPSFGSKSEMLSVLTKSEGISPVQAVYVGDRSDDRRAAADNGLMFIAAMWGYRDDDLLCGDGVSNASDAKQVRQILLDLLGPAIKP
jgi:phosphoglycolate phosphatase